MREPELPRLERHDADARLDVDARRSSPGVFAATSSMSMPPAALAIIDRLAGRAIEHEAQIQLARHLQAFFDQHARRRRGLRGRSGASRASCRACRARCCSASSADLRELDAAALAAAAGVDLRLDDDHAAAEARGDLAALRRRLNATSPRGTGTPWRARMAFGLILVDFHDGRKLLMLIGSRIVKCSRQVAPRNK